MVVEPVIQPVWNQNRVKRRLQLSGRRLRYFIKAIIRHMHLKCMCES
jgi:hypothetical protein